ncbi:MAG: CARDB domain-containing protein [Desulfobacteraceae bacterium]
MNRLQNLVLIVAVISFAVFSNHTLLAQTVKKPKGIVNKAGSFPSANSQVKPLPAGTVNTAVKRKALPDLQVGVMKITPLHPGEGKTVTFEGNVMNYGLGSAQNPVVVLTVSGPAGTSFPIFRKQFNVTLGKNQGITLVEKFKVPKHGNYTCTFKLDPARMIAETNDTNNNKQLTFSVHPLPDLIVCISNGKRPPLNRKRDIHAVVKNIGSGNCADYVKLRFYVEGKGTQTYDLLPINAGDSRKVTRRVKWSTAGTKTITAKVIYPKNESHKNNNEARGSYFVRLPHHDKYSAAPGVKCSNNKDYYNWEQCCN